MKRFSTTFLLTFVGLILYISEAEDHKTHDSKTNSKPSYKKTLLNDANRDHSTSEYFPNSHSLNKAQPTKAKQSSKSFQEQFTTLQRKYLKNEEETSSFKLLLSSKDKMDRSITCLISYEDNWDSKDQEERMFAVDFLTESLKYKKNPNKGYLYNKLNSLFKDDRYFYFKDKKQIKSIAGDRIEVFGSIIENNPSLARTIYENNKREKSRKILSLAMRMYDFDVSNQ